MNVHTFAANVGDKLLDKIKEASDSPLDEGARIRWCALMDALEIVLTEVEQIGVNE